MSFGHECRIVVMGGSFNPPTMAHLHLMEAAIEAVGAQKGIFVPVGEPYLKRKMRRAEDRIRFDERTRLSMLLAMCAGRENLIVSDVQMRDPSLRTKETMQILQERCPSAKLYFLAGADKLPLIGDLAARTDFFQRFGVVLFSREGMNTEDVIDEDERFAPYKQCFVHAKQPEGVDGISSTAVRRRIAAREADRACADLHQDVFEMIRHLTPEDFPLEIERFQGEVEFLSNDFPCTVVYDGLAFSCAEAAFQAARCACDRDKRRISQGDGSRAKQITAAIEPRADWEKEKLSVMEAVLRAKFSQNPRLAKRLADTGGAVLINGNKGKDLCWGRDLYSDRGENRLGRLLMNIRSEIQQEMERDKE